MADRYQQAQQQFQAAQSQGQHLPETEAFLMHQFYGPQTPRQSAQWDERQRAQRLRTSQQWWASPEGQAARRRMQQAQFEGPAPSPMEQFVGMAPGGQQMIDQMHGLQRQINGLDPHLQDMARKYLQGLFGQ